MFGPECDLSQSIQIDELDFEQLRTFEPNFGLNDSKLKYMSLIIIPHLCFEDSAGEVGRISRSCES